MLRTLCLNVAHPIGVLAPEERNSVGQNACLSRRRLRIRVPSRPPVFSCALAGDLARSDKRTRALVSRKIRDNIELLATLIRNANETDRDSARSQAVLTYCARSVRSVWLAPYQMRSFRAKS
jgi:hypothetical protein